DLRRTPVRIAEEPRRGERGQRERRRRPLSTAEQQRQRDHARDGDERPAVARDLDRHPGCDTIRGAAVFGAALGQSHVITWGRWPLTCLIRWGLCPHTPPQAMRCSTTPCAQSDA